MAGEAKGSLKEEVRACGQFMIKLALTHDNPWPRWAAPRLCRANELAAWLPQLLECECE